MVMKSERIYIVEVAAILGIPMRSVQAMAARGRIPSAARVSKRWTFNERSVRDFLKSEELRCQSEGQRPAAHSGNVVSFGAACVTPVDQQSFDHCTRR